MPRKSTTSVAATDPNSGDVSMVSEAQAPIHTSSPKQQKEKEKEKPTEKFGRKSGGRQDGDITTIEDLLLPRSIVQRIAKGVLPPNTSLQKDAILALTKSATVFISHLADSANGQTDRKTIQSADVIKALREIEFDTVMGVGVVGEDGKRGGRVEREIESWEGNVRGKRAGYREKVKMRLSTGDGEAEGDVTAGTLEGDDGDGLEGNDGRRENKRLRIDEDEQGGREGSATGEIASSTQKLRLGKKRADQDEEDVDDDVDEDEEEEDSDEQDEDDEEEEELQDDVAPQDLEDPSQMDVDGHSMSRNKVTLAPDGRVEVDASDEESD